MSLHARLSSRRAAASLLGPVFGLLALGACAAQDKPPAQAGAGGLYARGIDEIGDFYLEPVSNRRLALAGASHLSRLDGKLAVGNAFGQRSADAVTVSYDGRDVAFLAAPAENDRSGWGALIAEVEATAKQVSPSLAALPPERIDRAVFHGMTAALDGYSRYSGPAAAADQRAEREGFGGIGVAVDTSDRQLRVAAVSPHSPAASAGLQPEDQIVSINGVKTAGCSQEEAIHQLRGPIGSPISLQVTRSGLPARDLHLQRAYVTEPTVTASRHGSIAVLQISSFNRTTSQRVAETLAELQRQPGGPLAGIVLDLRGNPGGLLDQAVNLADLFVHDGPIVATQGRHPASEQHFAAKGDSITALPMAVLINGGSASASEIVAATLQDAGRAVVIGSSSYGKGTVQTVIRLPNNGELIVTWARLMSRAGYLLQHHGVVPTLCTARVPDDAGPLDVRLQQAAAVTVASGPQPRAGLDERGWSTLRAACPPLRTRPALDLQLAGRLLSDPKLYAEALRALPATTQVAARGDGRTLP